LPAIYLLKYYFIGYKLLLCSTGTVELYHQHNRWHLPLRFAKPPALLHLALYSIIRYRRINCSTVLRRYI
jgi:hypothetical protein